MKILCGCEESGELRRALRSLGHDAWSCDLLPASDGSPYHYQCDIFDIAYQDWDMAVFFPPCTFLTVAAARWQHDHWVKSKKGDWWHDGSGHRFQQKLAVEFVKNLWKLPIPKIAIENPVGRLSTLWRKPDQTFQPWEFWDGEPGKGEVKRTCLWLKNLRKLVPTTPDETGRHPAVWLMTPSATRSMDRSKTYPGVAKAMALQWTT